MVLKDLRGILVWIGDTCQTGRGPISGTLSNCTWLFSSMPHTLNGVAIQRYAASFKHYKLGGNGGTPTYLAFIPYPVDWGINALDWNIPVKMIKPVQLWLKAQNYLIFSIKCKLPFCQCMVLPELLS